jgi:predicted dienelactone hydrolase
VGAQHPVARIDVDLVDTDRPPVSRGAAADAGGRLLRTVVRFPDVRSAGPFPLVVFAHGYATSTAAYASLLDDLAAAGYVVAAPELPVTSTALAGPVGGREPEEQVRDVTFVTTAVLDLAAGDGPLHGVVRDGPVAVVGHSDGGMTAAAAAFASRVRDARVGAAVVLSGARGDFGGTWFPAGSPALLAVHGDADPVNPFASSQTLYAADRSGSPRYLVRVRGGGHDDAFTSARTRPALVVLVDDFLRAALGTDPSAADRVPTDASAPGVLDLLGA